MLGLSLGREYVDRPSGLMVTCTDILLEPDSEMGWAFDNPYPDYNVVSNVNLTVDNDQTIDGVTDADKVTFSAEAQYLLVELRHDLISGNHASVDYSIDVYTDWNGFNIDKVIPVGFAVSVTDHPVTAGQWNTISGTLPAGFIHPSIRQFERLYFNSVGSDPNIPSGTEIYLKNFSFSYNCPLPSK